MKQIKLFGALLLSSMLFVVSCDKYDDSKLTGRVEGLESKVDDLQTKIQNITSNLNALTKVVDALNSRDEIVSINKLPDDRGWEIVFSQSGSIKIYNGDNGKDGNNGTDGTDGHSPIISVKQDADGIYYWTIDGKYLLVDGHKVPATAEYGVPQIKIADGKFWFSVDNGANWIPCGDVTSEGIGTIKGVEDKGDCVIFTLYDNSTITIPKVQSFSLNIQNSDIGLTAGETVDIPYSITTADTETKITAIPVNGYAVKVVMSDNASGILKITAPTPIVDADIYVVAVNGDGVTSGKILSFAAGQLDVIYDAQNIPAKGGNVTITVNTNLEYEVVIPEADNEWISIVPITKALRSDLITFSIAENTMTALRSSTVNINFKSGETAKTVVFTQEAASAVEKEWVSADLITFNVDDSAFANGNTETGWTGENIKKQVSESSFNQQTFIRLNGQTSAPGKIYSPLLGSGCSKIVLDYGVASLTNSLPNGVSITLSVFGTDDSIIFEKDIVRAKADIVRGELYTTEEFEVNVSGQFKIVLRNNCPGGKDSNRYDNTDILRIAWLPMD